MEKARSLCIVIRYWAGLWSWWWIELVYLQISIDVLFVGIFGCMWFANRRCCNCGMFCWAKSFAIELILFQDERCCFCWHAKRLHYINYHIGFTHLFNSLVSLSLLSSHLQLRYHRRWGKHRQAILHQDAVQNWTQGWKDGCHVGWTWGKQRVVSVNIYCVQLCVFISGDYSWLLHILSTYSNSTSLPHKSSQHLRRRSNCQQTWPYLGDEGGHPESQLLGISPHGLHRQTWKRSSW